MGDLREFYPRFATLFTQGNFISAARTAGWEINMTSMIYNPVEEFEGKFKELHLENAKKYFEDLVQQSGINIEENRKTVKEYDELKNALPKIKRKYNLWRFLRVIMIITLILIPLVIIKITPKIKALRSEIEKSGKKIDELLANAHQQMRPLTDLFTDRDALKLIESTIPMLSFAPCFSAKQEADMLINYDFCDNDNGEQSTTDVLAGHYNENPFLFENKIVHKMGVETYHGYKTIYWTESYRDSDGKTRTRTRSETLHATVIKPKPFYSTQIMLNYCAQGGPELSFTRNATHLERKTDKEIDRYVKKGEKKLKKMTDKAIKQNKDFVSMSNSDFEVLFDALDRTNEVQFRTLFTPLAQTNMVDLIRSKSGYGDDFNFIKQNRTNRIISQHSQGRVLALPSRAYASHSFDIIKENFINKNTDYFKSVYFDFAPIWAIPIYQERPVHSLHPIPESPQTYSYKEYEALSNKASTEFVVHPKTKTPAILKSSFVNSQNSVDEIAVSAYSYNIVQRIDFIPVHGKDGHWHNVPVPWDDYIPLKATNTFYVAEPELAQDRNIIARYNNICIFN